MAKTDALVAAMDADPAVLLVRIKEGAKAYEVAALAAARIGAQVYLDSYTYVEALLNSNRVESMPMALQALADAVHRKPSTMSNWYAKGRLISQERLDVQSIDPSAVDAFARARGTVPKSAQLRIISMIKRGENGGEIRRALTAARPPKEAKALADKGQLTKLRCKMEMMGVQSLISQFFGERVDMLALDKTGNVLLESDG